MKTFMKGILIILGIGISYVSFAQEIDLNNQPFDELSYETADLNTQHAFKLNIPSLAVGTFSFQYEYFPVNFMSLNLGFKFTPNRGMIFKSQVIDLLEDSNDLGSLKSPGEKFFQEFKFSGNAFTPEVRFYLGEGYGRGFYLGPMVRVDNYKFNTVYSFDYEGEHHDIGFEGKFKAFGYGLTLGLQYPIGKNLTIDTFIAPYLSNVKIDFNSNSSYSLSDEAVLELDDELNEFQLPNGKTDIELSNSSAKGKLTSDTFPNLRVGVGFGYRF